MRLWPKLDVADCWEWTRYCDEAGYGVVKVARKVRRAHRIVWEVLVGRIPFGLTLDHLCRNRRCCNPDHLEAVTLRENIMRGGTPAAVNARKKTCELGHELVMQKSGKRRCPTCKKVYQASYRKVSE